MYSVTSEFRTFENLETSEVQRFLGPICTSPDHSGLLNSGNFQNIQILELHYTVFCSTTVVKEAKILNWNME